MPVYTPEQVQIIAKAVQKAREAMQRARRFEAVVFAQAFIENDGIQIPGKAGNEPLRKRVAQHVLESLKTGGATSDDATVLREIKRAHAEVRWASSAESDKVVGFYLTLGPAAQQLADCHEFLNRDYGLGAAVFPKGRVVILPPTCDDHQFVPVLEDEVEQ